MNESKQREAASLDLHAWSREGEGGKDFSATPKPCSTAATVSSLKTATFFTSRRHSAITFTNNTRGVVRGEMR